MKSPKKIRSCGFVVILRARASLASGCSIQLQVCQLTSRGRVAFRRRRAASCGPVDSLQAKRPRAGGLRGGAAGLASRRSRASASEAPTRSEVCRGFGFCAFLRLFAAIPLPGIAAGDENVSARERAAYGVAGGLAGRRSRASASEAPTGPEVCGVRFLRLLRSPLRLFFSRGIGGFRTTGAPASRRPTGRCVGQSTVAGFGERSPYRVGGFSGFGFCGFLWRFLCSGIATGFGRRERPRAGGLRGGALAGRRSRASASEAPTRSEVCGVWVSRDGSEAESVGNGGWALRGQRPRLQLAG